MSNLLNDLLTINQLSYDDCVLITSKFENAVESLEHLKIPFNDTTRKHLNARIKELGLKFTSTKGWKYQVDDVRRAITNCDNFSAVCRELGVSVCTFNIKRIQTVCVTNGIDYSHFDYNNSKLHKTKMKERTTRTVENSLVENSTLARSHLRGLLIRNGLFTNQCSCCGITEWQGKPITIEVDHINGISDDNRIENLRLLCPNCHSQTETFKTGNIDKLKPRANIKKQSYSAVDMSECAHCGKEFIKHTSQSKFCSIECSNKSKHDNKWDEMDLINLVDVQNISFRQISIQMGVSLNAVRRQYLKRKAAV